MSLVARLLLIAIIVGGFSNCDGNKAGTAIPRRHAYPRIELPQENYHDITVGCNELHISVNEVATYNRRVADDGETCFIDVSYPKLSSTIFYTITPVDDATIEDVIANRLERIRLNLGDSDAELIEFNSTEGFENKVLVSHGNISTPVQFISTDGENVVVSGVAFIKDASPATADSIAPIVDVIRRDIVHSLKMIHR